MPKRRFEPPASDSGSSIIDLKTGKPVRPATAPVIGDRIRYYRKLAGIEQKDLAERIGVTGNAVSIWERGGARPDIHLLPEICRALHITLYELYALDDPNARLSAKETSLIEKFRKLSPGHQMSIEQLVDSLLHVQLAESVRPIRELKSFTRALAAGIGEPSEMETEGEPLYVYDSPELARADWVFPVSGDSMEPDFHNQDLVLVSRSQNGQELKYGEIGAFMVGNETFIKEYRKDGLHSLNPAYSVMHFSEEDQVYLIGRVLGVLHPAQIATDRDVAQYFALNES